MPGAQQSVVIHTPPDVLYDIITDYTKYPDFLSHISSARVEDRTEEATIVTFELRVIRTVDYTIRLTGTRPTEVSWTFVRSSILTDLVGGWTLVDLGDNRTKATYSLDVSVGIFVPRPIANGLTQTTLPSTLAAFKRRAEGR